MNESFKNKYEHDLKEIKRIEGIVEQQKRWGQAHNFITAASKQKEADRIKDGLVAPESELETMRMHFEPRCESGNDVLICKNLAKSFDNKQLFKMLIYISEKARECSSSAATVVVKQRCSEF